jgi:NADH:ubiquinone oxidoreductase subunit
MREFLTQFFTWWNGQTLGTRLHTWRFGERVGQDEFGNTYYRTAGGKIDPTLGFERRWVIYAGVSEGSATPPGWYGWLHHTIDQPPTEAPYAAHDWELPYRPNMTGTPLAYRPSGSLARGSARPAATGDYQAWRPEG